MRGAFLFPITVWRTVIRIVGCVALAALTLGGSLSPAQTGAGAVPAARKASNVAVITVKGEITKVTATSVQRRITLAERAGADAVVFELDTPGGDLYAALTICGLVKQCPVPNTVAWVNTKAYSAGAVIALACRDIVTNSTADFGDALPIVVSPLQGIVPLPQAERQKITAPLLAEVVDSARLRGRDEYFVQGFVSLDVQLWLVENVQTGKRMCVDENEYRLMFGEEPPVGHPHVPSARTQGPRATPPAPRALEPETSPASAAPDTANPAAAPDTTSPLVDPAKRVSPASPALKRDAEQAGMRQSLDTARPVITAADKGKWKLIEFVSDGSGPLVLKADDLIHYKLATEKVNSDEELKAYFGAKNLRRLDESWSEGMVTFLTNMAVRGVLVVILLIALFLEMTHPGVILPGAVAGVALFALLAPPLIIGMANWWEVAAIVGGLVLILLELFVIPGFGVVGIVGILALFAGLVGTFVPSGSGGLFPDTARAKNDLLYGFTTVMASAATAMVGMYFLGKHFGSLPLLGRLVLKSPDPEAVDAGGMLSAMDPGMSDLRPGLTGTSITPLRPSGRVQFGERIVDVVAELGWIPSGAAVRIVSASEFRVAVELVPGASAPPSAAQGGTQA